jgi:hypothetical protein
MNEYIKTFLPICTVLFAIVNQWRYTVFPPAGHGLYWS